MVIEGVSHGSVSRMSVAPSIASVVDKYLQGGQAQAFPRSSIERDWRQWLPAMMPGTFTCDFAPHHARFWDWLWSVKRDVRPRPYVLPLPRHGGKSSSVEGAVVALGARKIRDYGFYCHERGTSVYDPARPDAGWSAVEDHPSARSIVSEGFTVEISGLPNISLAETVTAEHRYWAMRLAARCGHDAQEYFYGKPHWIEAQHLDWNTWIGYPIDQTVLDNSEYPTLATWNRATHGDALYDMLPYPLFHNPEFWWMVGYWWGDGSLGGCRRSQVTFSCAEKYPDRQDRLVEFLASTGNHPKVRRVAETAQFEVRIGDSVLARWLHTWKHGNSRKEPPSWVEYLPLNCQRELLRGYIAADANIDDRGVHLTSIHLPGLLSVRRMLMRLGVVCQIASTRSPSTSTFPEGRTYRTQRAYRLNIEHPGLLGFPETPRASRHIFKRVFIRDGFLWSRVVNVSETDQREFIPIQTESETYLTAFGRSHNCSMTQPQADDHLTSIEPKLGTESVRMYYPDLSERHVGLHGDGTHWRRQRLWTKRGLIIDALGIDTAARGRKLGDQRPSLIIFDDIDDKDESSTARLKKMETMKSDIIGAASHDAMIIFIQNKVHRDSIMSQLIDGRADFLADAIIERPCSALEDFKYETRTLADETGYTRQRHFILSGTPIWEGQDVEACQGQLDNMGLDSFLREVQQDVERATTGALLSMFEEQWSVITKTEFQAVYSRAATDKNGDMRIPSVGYLANFQDIGCLTLDTEILTKDGWKRHDQLKVGELVAGYNWKRPLYPRRWKHKKTTRRAVYSQQYLERQRAKQAMIDGPPANVGELVWTPLRGIVYKSDQPLVRLESKSFDFTCTPDHAWIVRRKKRERMKQDTYQRQPLNKIPRSPVAGGSRADLHLVLAAKCTDEGEIQCPPAMAAVLGWVITDGWISEGLAYISQKKYPEAVIADLEESGLKWREIQPHKDGVRIFSVGGRKGLKRLCEATGFTAKDKLPKIVTRLSPEARERMLEVMFMADGTGRRGPRGIGSGLNFCQNKGPVLEAFEILATLSGIRLRRPHLHEGGGFLASCVRAIEKYGHRQYRVALMARPHVLMPRVDDLPGLHDVWCPTVDEGAVVARCNGQIAITGNSTPGHPNANIWAWRPEQGMPLGDSVFGYRELTLPEYPEPVTLDPSPLTVAMAIHRLEAPWQEGENHRMTRRLSHEKPDWANFYNMDLPKVTDPDTGRPMKALRYGQWSPVKSGGLGTLQSYMAVIEREHSDTCPHKQGEPLGCSQWLHATDCPHRSDQRKHECWARRNPFRPWLWGRSRFMLVVDDDQGAIEGGKQRQPYNARGFVRLRAEIPRFTEEKLKGGPAKVFDDMIDTALKLAENFFVPIARQKVEDQVQAAIPEAYRQNAPPEAVESLNDLARANYQNIQYVLETNARAIVREQRKSSQIYSHGTVRRNRG